MAEEEPEEDPSDVVTYTARGGQTVIISREALQSYGEAFIDQVALTSGKKALVLADEHILAQAKEEFPDSDTPLIDKYHDYLLDFGDIPKDKLINTATQEAMDEDQITSMRNTVNEGLETQLQDNIDNNSPAAITQPNGDRGFIIIPSASTLEDDTYKETIINGLSGLSAKQVGDIPGSSMDWAKISVYHETAHLDLNHTNLDMSDVTALINGNLNHNDQHAAGFSKFKLKGEIEADIRATKDFNKVSGTVPPIAQSFANLRLINSFVVDGDIIDLGANAMDLDDHNTGSSVLTALEKGSSPDINGDQIQFTTAYTNTMVRGLIGAAEGRDYLSRTPNAWIGLQNGNPLRGTMGSMINNQGMDASLRGDDPIRLSRLGNKIAYGAPEKLYASTKALLEAGQFDNAPEVKQNAERFVRAIDKEAPGLVNQELVDKYRTAMQDPVNQNFMQQLQRYYNPEDGINYLVSPKPQAQVQSAPAPSMAMVPS